jgi:hypothetical protein
LPKAVVGPARSHRARLGGIGPTRDQVDLSSRSLKLELEGNRGGGFGIIGAIVMVVVISSPAELSACNVGVVRLMLAEHPAASRPAASASPAGAF